MGPQGVHQGLQHLGRIVFGDGHHGLAQARAVVLPPHEAEDRGAPGVVHHGVQLAVHKVAAADRIGDLVGGVLPDLAQQDGIRLQLPHPPLQTEDEFVGQLVGHVQAHPVRAQPEPARQHAVIVPDDVVEIGFVQLLHLRQGFKIPPAVVLVRPAAEMIPGVIGGLLPRGGRAGAEDAAPVEVDRIAPGVGEDAVKDQLHPPGVDGVAEGAEVVVGSQHRVEALIVGGVVAVVGEGHADGVEIDHPHAQVPQLVQPGGDAPEIAAEEVVAEHLAGGRVGAPLGHAAPVGAEDEGPELPGQVTVPDFAEAVGEDLVHDPAPEIGRDIVVRGDHAELPLFARLHVGPVALPEEAEGAGPGGNAEPVEVQAPGRRGKMALEAVVVPVLARPGKGELAGRRAVFLFQNQLDKAAMDLPRHLDPDDAGLPFTQRTEGLLAGRVTGIVKNTHDRCSFKIG